MKRHFFALFTVATTMHAQPDPWDRMVSVGRSVFAEFKRQVHPLLTPSQRAIAERVTYRVLPVPLANARAWIDADGTRRIDLGAGIMIVFEAMSVAMAMESIGSLQCGKDYLKVLLDDVMEATYRKTLGQQGKYMIQPFDYAAQHPQTCQGVTLERFRANSTAQRGQQALVGGSLRWLLAHELAHHLHNHARSAPRDLADSRARETEADRFAHQVAIKDGPDAIIWAMPAYLFMGRLGPSAESEDANTHPAGARRAGIIFDTLASVIQNDQSLKADLESRGLLKPFLEKFSAIRAAIEDELR